MPDAAASSAGVILRASIATAIGLGEAEPRPNRPTTDVQTSPQSTAPPDDDLRTHDYKVKNPRKWQHDVTPQIKRYWHPWIKAMEGFTPARSFRQRL